MISSLYVKSVTNYFEAADKSLPSRQQPRHKSLTRDIKRNQNPKATNYMCDAFPKWNNNGYYIPLNRRRRFFMSSRSLITPVSISTSASGI
ncbi:hypothetical protein CEXT_141461 [Caerostris extrusa]|uniref:Uncharacterized protein n=1 Tax=Caerostris extrusa TaxID=172846 RepID=A0AAV4QZS2_CAEEX|nr:hypothetical protein CEXT_141461 [Caerostris extrusa]